MGGFPSLRLFWAWVSQKRERLHLWSSDGRWCTERMHIHCLPLAGYRCCAQTSLSTQRGSFGLGMSEGSLWWAEQWDSSPKGSTPWSWYSWSSVIKTKWPTIDSLELHTLARRLSPHFCTSLGRMWVWAGYGPLTLWGRATTLPTTSFPAPAWARDFEKNYNTILMWNSPHHVFSSQVPEIFQ